MADLLKEIDEELERRKANVPERTNGTLDLSEIDAELARRSSVETRRFGGIAHRIATDVQSLFDPEVRPTLEGRYIKQAATSVIRTLGRFVAEIPQTVALSAKLQTAIPNMASELVGLPQYFESPDKDLQDYALYRVGTTIENFVNENFAGDPELAESFVAEKLPGAFTEMFTFLAGGTALKAIGAPARLGVAGLGAARGAIGQQKEAAAFGASEEDQVKAALLGGAVGTSEALPVARIFKRFDRASRGLLGRRASRIISEGFKGGVEELIQESFAGAAGNVIAQRIYDNERGLFDEVAEGGELGGIVGFTTSVIATAAGARNRRARAIRQARKKGQIVRQELSPDEINRIAEIASETMPQEAVEKAAKSGEVGKDDSPLFAGMNSEARKRVAQQMARRTDPDALTPVELMDTGQLMAESKRRGVFVEKNQAFDVETGSTSEESWIKANRDAVQRERAREERVPVTPQEEESLRATREVQEKGAPTDVVATVAEGNDGPALGDETGATPIDQVRSGAESGVKMIRATVRRYFTKEGDLPPDVFNELVGLRGELSAVNRQVATAVKEFDRSVKEVYGVPFERLQEREVVFLDDALRDKKLLDAVPDPLRSAMVRMRDDMDAYSRAMIESGAVQGKLAKVIDKNLGTYLKRAYRVFYDPQWARRIDPAIKNRAKSWLRSGLADQNLSEKQLDNIIAELLTGPRKAQSLVALLTEGKPIGRKNVSMLIKRKGIPVELRELWGEIRDPRLNYVISQVHLGQFVAKHKFLTQVRDGGMGKYFFNDRTINDDGMFVEKIEASASSMLSPLNEVYTTTEIADALRNRLEPQQTAPWLRAFMGINGVAKLAKTVGSAATHAKNFTGGLFMVGAQGHWRVGKFGSAAKTTWQTITNNLKGDDQLRAYILDLQRRGIIDESVRAGEVREFFNDVADVGLEDLIGRRNARIGKKALAAPFRAAQKLYQSEDNIWRIYAYESELARFRKALGKELSDDEIKDIAADRVRNTYPTYSMVPEAIKKLRRFPAYGTFVSFPWEVYRTNYNTLRFAAQELRDPRLRKIGAERLAGWMTVHAMVPGIAYSLKAALGMDDDEEKDLRLFLPDYSKNNQLMWLGRDPELTYTYQDMTYTDPYSYFKLPIAALLSSKTWEEGLWNAAVETLSPFLQEEIMTKALLDISRNRTDQGFPVYNPAEPIMEQRRKQMVHLLQAIEPGTVQRMRRALNRSMRPLPTDSPAYDVIGEVTGFRVLELRVPRMLDRKMRRMSVAMGNANRVLDRIARSERAVTEQELAEKWQDMETARRKVFDEHRDMVSAARRLGMDRSQIIRILNAAGIPKSSPSGSSVTVGMLLNDFYRPRGFTDKYLDEAVERALAQGNRDLAQDLRNRRRFIRQLSRENRIDLSRPAGRVE